MKQIPMRTLQLLRNVFGEGIGGILQSFDATLSKEDSRQHLDCSKCVIMHAVNMQKCKS